MYIKKSKTASGIVFIYLPLPTDDVEQISQTVPASAAAIRYICMYVISGGGGGGSELDTHLIVRHLRYFIFLTRAEFSPINFIMYKTNTCTVWVNKIVPKKKNDLLVVKISLHF